MLAKVSKLAPLGDTPCPNGEYVAFETNVAGRCGLPKIKEKERCLEPRLLR